MEQGCSDGNCLLRIGPVIGQHTNGGCRCLSGVPEHKRLEICFKIHSQWEEIRRLKHKLECLECGLTEYEEE